MLDTGYTSNRGMCLFRGRTTALLQGVPLHPHVHGSSQKPLRDFSEDYVLPACDSPPEKSSSYRRRRFSWRSRSCAVKLASPPHQTPAGVQASWCRTETL